MNLKSLERILTEDALKHIHECEAEGHAPTILSVAGALEIIPNNAARLLATMTAHRLLEVAGDGFRLTATGREYALHIIRAHRLWERYLADQTGFPEAEWHDRANRQEHILSPDQVNVLAAQLGYPSYDPHGDPIPTAQGELPLQQHRSITQLAAGETARIVHLEDEPESIRVQLVAAGLYPGMEVRLGEVSPQAVHFWSNEREHVLTPIVAANITVVPLAGDQTSPAGPTLRLSELELGEQGRVVDILPACRGQERRRFMDLGILPGTLIKAEMRSPSGDPTAYFIRDALIALRREQANLVNIRRLEGVSL